MSTVLIFDSRVYLENPKSNTEPQSGNHTNLHQQMGKEHIVPYPHNGILVSHEEEQSTDIGHNVDEPQKWHAKWKEPLKIDHMSNESVCMKYPEHANP